MGKPANSAVTKQASLTASFITAACLLTACGGGGGDQPKTEEAQPQRHALAADAPAIDAAALFGWAEKSFPALFPAGPQNEELDYEGKHYTIRHYAGTQNYLGVSGDNIYGLGGFTGDVLQGFGKLSDWSCQVLGQSCLSGVVASGAAWVAATVEAKCTGSAGVVTASTTTGLDGSYSLAVKAASLPCVVRARAADASVLHAAAAGSGNTASSTVHVTPMTDLALAYAAGAETSAVYAGFTVAIAPQLSASAMQSASAAVVATLKAAGVDFSAVGDVSSAPLNPGSGGDAHGQALAQLQSKLGGSLTQGALADAMVRTRPDQKAAGTPSLPANLLLRPAAPNCVALRSGSYRAVFSDLSDKTARITINAPALTITRSAGVATVLSASGKCHYKQSDGLEFAVSDAGVLLGRARTAGGGLRAMVAFPEQSFTLADIAGVWSGLTLEDATRDGEGYIHAFALTTAADGKVNAITYCGKDAGKVASDCVIASNAAQGLPSMFYTVDADGGFDLVNTTDGWVERGFFYRSGSGDLMSASGGHLSLGTLQRALVLPDVGRVREFWNLSVTAQLTNNAYVTPSAMTQVKNTVVSVDAAAQSYVREAVSNFDTGATRPERLQINRFLDGFSHRIGETVRASDGSSQTVSELVLLTLPGTGLTPIGILGSTQSFSLSLLQSTAP